MRASRWAATGAALGAVVTMLAGPGQASASEPLGGLGLSPADDWEVGLVGAAAFGTSGGEAFTGPLIGVEGAWRTGLFGVHAGLAAFQDADAWRVAGSVEASVWYLVEVAVGVSLAGRVADTDGAAASQGPRAPDVLPAVHATLAIPFPLWNTSLTYSDPDAGAVVGAPYFRASMRFLEREEVEGFFELGVRLRWSTFAFGTE